MSIGIDPGISGAICLLDDDVAVRVWDMPVLEGARGKRAVCAALLADLIREARGMSAERPTAYVERVGPMPGQGVTSMFSFGRSAGVVEGVLGALGMRCVLISPQTWKRQAKLIGKPKDESRCLAMRMFPELSVQLRRKKDGGRADAALIGYFGSISR